MARITFQQGVGLTTFGIMCLSLPLSALSLLHDEPSSFPPETVTSTPTSSPSPTTYETDSLPLPSTTERATEPVALVYDPSTNTSIVYPDTLPPCDNEDGTPVSNGKIVAACKWDASSDGINSAGDSFIVIHP